MTLSLTRPESWSDFKRRFNEMALIGALATLVTTDVSRFGRPGQNVFLTSSIVKFLKKVINLSIPFKKHLVLTLMCSRRSGTCDVGVPASKVNQ